MRGRSPFAEWRAELDDIARAKITTAVLRLEQGNTSSLKGVGEGVSELKIDFGPGYRVYFGRDGATVGHRKSAGALAGLQTTQSGKVECH